MTKNHKQKYDDTPNPCEVQFHYTPQAKE